MDVATTRDKAKVKEKHYGGGDGVLALALIPAIKIRDEMGHTARRHRRLGRVPVLGAREM